jgi:hypothetical protein
MTNLDSLLYKDLRQAPDLLGAESLILEIALAERYREGVHALP